MTYALTNCVILKGFVYNVTIKDVNGKQVVTANLSFKNGDNYNSVQIKAWDSNKYTFEKLTSFEDKTFVQVSGKFQNPYNKETGKSYPAITLSEINELTKQNGNGNGKDKSEEPEPDNDVEFFEDFE
jgi:DNA polymerase III alpha subunit (gram-positive type)